MRRSIELDLGRIFGFGLGGLGVGFVGVVTLANGLENARGVPLGKFDLLQRVCLWGAPFSSKIEKGSSSVKSVGGLPGKGCAVSFLLPAYACAHRSAANPVVVHTLSPCWRAWFSPLDRMSLARTSPRMLAPRRYR